MHHVPCGDTSCSVIFNVQVLRDRYIEFITDGTYTKDGWCVDSVSDSEKHDSESLPKAKYSQSVCLGAQTEGRTMIHH